jgi:selenocysteine lyase/cysteine desulfurase
LQSIKTALCFQLKEQMGIENIRAREEELLQLAFAGLDSIPEVKILANKERGRLGVISFYVPGIHYNLLVQLLNDLYGIQVRGGCACAGTYGHFLLEVSAERSSEITEQINHGDLSEKPGWVRWSLHPTMTDEEVTFFIEVLKDIIVNIEVYSQAYEAVPRTNTFRHKRGKNYRHKAEEWFEL